MAVSFLLLLNATNGNGRYFGKDIRVDLIDWLSQAYSRYHAIKFELIKANANVDYLDANNITVNESDGSEAEIGMDKDCIDLQWSSSLFTHLTPAAMKKMLCEISDSSRSGGIQVNSWLIVDTDSRYAMRLGIADRKLDIDMGEYLTYSKNNPLVCVAYKDNYLHLAYKEAGLEIIDIMYGSWRGGLTKNDAGHYQDLVISKKIV